MNSAKKVLHLLVVLMGLAVVVPSSAYADFGISSLTAAALNRDGSVDLRAGSHPYEFKVDFGINLHEDALKTPEGRLRTIIVDLPAGMVGNPLAVPRCSRALFDKGPPLCPPASQVGVTHIAFVNNGQTDVEAESPVYNLTPSLGSPASIGFNLANIDTFQDASLRTGGDYGVRISDVAIPAELEFQSVTETIWGVPMDPQHAPERFCTGSGPTGCPSEADPAPFLTLPTSCAAPLATTVRLESLEEPGVLVSKTVRSENEDGEPAGLRDCEALPFSPSLTVRPETEAADSPTGLHVDLHLPQTKDPNVVAAAHLKDTVINLPRGLAVNPSAANGLASCSLAQIELHGSEPARCPDASTLGNVEISTPLVDHLLPGSVFLARQGENPFGALIALYIVVHDPLTGVVVKLPGRVSPNQDTGQLSATFEENPQLPFEDLEVEFFGGPRAALTTPATCGTYGVAARMTPWSAPEGPDVLTADSFSVRTGAGAGGCPASEAETPNAPSFEAGTSVPMAGTFSPFVLRVDREDGSQRIRALNVTLPPGVSGKLAGLTECSEAGIAEAEGRSGLGDGALERANPSCPMSAEVGVVNVGAGSGQPLFVQGHAYLAGPYKGAPLSLVIITPAVAGPFDLGSVVVRTALYVDEETAQIRAVSDPIPTIIQGIPLDVRSIALNMDRPRFTLNPTNCDPMSVLASTATPAGGLAQLSQHFQVGGCEGLGFKPGLKIQLTGPTKRAGHPALKAVVTYPKRGSYANIARAQVGLPHSEFLDQGNLDKVCTRPELRASNCPKSSIYGHAKAWTPLLDKPLQGPVYLGVGYGDKLPDVVADLNGQIRILLHGRVDTTKEDGIRNTFEVVPDAPVSRFVLELKGGRKYGLLQNSENICLSPQRAKVRFVAQDGAIETLTPQIANSCQSGRSHAHESHPSHSQ